MTRLKCISEVSNNRRVWVGWTPTKVVYMEGEVLVVRCRLCRFKSDQTLSGRLGKWFFFFFDRFVTEYLVQSDRERKIGT